MAFKYIITGKIDINTNDELNYTNQLLPNDTSNAKSPRTRLMQRHFFPNDNKQTKILGSGWSKASDTLYVMIPTYQPKAITKQYIPSYVASIYNTVRIISASHFIGKVIYRQLQDGKVPWYTKVFVGLQKKIEKWVIETNSVKSEAPRSRVLAEESTRFTCVCWCQYCS